MKNFQFNPNLSTKFPEIATATEGCIISNNNQYNHLQPDQVEEIAKLHNQSYETIILQFENIEEDDLQDEAVEDLENNLSGHYILQLAHYAGLTIKTE